MSNQTPYPKPETAEQPTDKGLDETPCSVWISNTDGGTVEVVAMSEYSNTVVWLRGGMRFVTSLNTFKQYYSPNATVEASPRKTPNQEQG